VICFCWRPGSSDHFSAALTLISASGGKKSERAAAAALSHRLLISSAEAAAGKGFNNLAISQVMQAAKLQRNSWKKLGADNAVIK
jgi:hypothetical protein